MALPQLFGLLPAGQPLVVEPTTFDSSTGSFTYNVPTNPAHPFSHLAIFLLPGQVNQIPQNKAAALYVSLAGPGSAPETFHFVGGIGHGKESGIFKVASAQAAVGVVTIGIMIEDEELVGQKVLGTKAATAHAVSVPANPAERVSTLQLAQRIITNAFNHLASHGQVLGGVEVIPLKAFQNWWQKFETKIKADPTFLERLQD